MSITRFNHGLYTGTKGIFLGLTTTALKAVIPSNYQPAQQEGTANAIFAIAIRKISVWHRCV